MTRWVLLVALVFGIVFCLNGFAQSTVSALADGSELSVVTLLGWVAVAIAVAGAVVGARWGLPGVIYGVGLGWLVRALSALYMPARHLRMPATAPAVTS